MNPTWLYSSSARSNSNDIRIIPKRRRRENNRKAFSLYKQQICVHMCVMWTYSISKQTLLLTGLEKRQLKLLLHHVNTQASQFRLFVTHHICYIKSKSSNICAFCNKRFQEHQHISSQTIFVGSRSAIQISEFYKKKRSRLEIQLRCKTWKQYGL